METVQYAIVAPGPGGQTCVSHIFEHRQEAVGCAAAYAGASRAKAEVALLQPPLTSSRTQDYWGVYSPGLLRVYTTLAKASEEASLYPASVLIAAPIGRAKPVQRGVPQFVVAP
jgi:hypothetical protein